GSTSSPENGLTRSYPADGSRERESSAFNPFSVPGFEPFGAGSPAPEHHPVWTAPHEGPAGEGLLVTSITPVFDGNEYRGIVAMDLSLARLIAQADTIKVTPNGYAFVIGRDGSVLPGEASGLVESELSGNGNPTLRQTVEAMRVGE